MKGAAGSRASSAKMMFGVAVAEKQIQHLKLIARGKPGHASMPHNDNANVTLLNALPGAGRPAPFG